MNFRLHHDERVVLSQCLTLQLISLRSRDEDFMFSNITSNFLSIVFFKKKVF
jgi:hypothetical protein